MFPWSTFAQASRDVRRLAGVGCPSHVVLEQRLQEPCMLILISEEKIYIQSNFSGSNTLGTMKISSRQGKFEPMRVDNRARSGGIISISLIFL